MKVLDLSCGNGHPFEGWFGSEADFQIQLSQGLVQCPLCSNSSVVKRLSAPRLNLGASEPVKPGRSKTAAADTGVSLGAAPNALGEPSVDGKEIVQAWMEMTKQILANTEDVGDKFVEEARKIHYGESDARSIRGHATRRDQDALIEEGISVMPLLIPEALKTPLQ